jgi:hypothetical protein
MGKGKPKRQVPLWQRGRQGDFSMPERLKPTRFQPPNHAEKRQAKLFFTRLLLNDIMSINYVGAPTLIQNYGKIYGRLATSPQLMVSFWDIKSLAFQATTSSIFAARRTNALFWIDEGMSCHAR